MNRLRLIEFALAVFLIAVMPVSAAATGYERPHLRLTFLSTSLKVPADPVAIYGRRVVWYGMNGPVAHRHFGFFMGTVGRWQPAPLPTAPMLRASTASEVLLSGRWLLWLDQSLPSSGTVWGISAFNLVTHKTYRVATSASWGTPNAEYNYPTISLSGDMAAWSVVTCPGSCQKAREIHSVIVVTKLPDGKPRIVASMRGNCQVTGPSISGHVVVFQREGLCYGNRTGCTPSTCRRNRGSDVEMLDLRTGKSKMLTHNRGSSEPVTNGQYVAWKQGKPGSTRFDDGAIELMKIGTEHAIPISLAIPGGYKTQCLNWTQKIGTVEGCADQPVIGRRLVAWSIASGSVNEARDIATGKEYYLSGGSAERDSLDIGQVSGHRAVWSEWLQRGSKQVPVIGMAWVP